MSGRAGAKVRSSGRKSAVERAQSELDRIPVSVYLFADRRDVSHRTSGNAASGHT
jgi:hypothetical protein